MSFRYITLLIALLALPLSPAAAADAAPQVVTLAVENMTCRACPITVRKSLQKVPGVTDVRVDFDRRTATVTFDPQRTSVEALQRATTHAGYPSTVAR